MNKVSKKKKAAKRKRIANSLLSENETVVAVTMTDLEARMAELERENARTLEIRRVTTDYNVALLDMDKARACVHQAAKAMRAVVLRDEAGRRPNMNTTWDTILTTGTAGAVVGTQWTHILT